MASLTPRIDKFGSLMASRTPLLDEFTDTLQVGIPARTGGQPVSDLGGMGQTAPAPQLDFSPLESLRQQLMQSIGLGALGLLPSRAEFIAAQPPAERRFIEPDPMVARRNMLDPLGGMGTTMDNARQRLAGLF